MNMAEAKAAQEKAANRLHHLSMRYAGALVELATMRKQGFIPQGYPGLAEARDLIDLVLLTRAEINALVALLLKQGVFSAERFVEQVTEEYEWLAQRKAEHLGVGISDVGLILTPDAFPGKEVKP